MVSEIKFNPKLSDIRDIAKKQKSENILNIIRFNEFESGSTKGGGIKILDQGQKDKTNDDVKLQFEILIEAEEEPEKKPYLESTWQKQENMMRSVLTNSWMILFIINFLSCKFSISIGIQFKVIVMIV